MFEFRVIVALRDLGCYSGIIEALKVLFEKVQELMDENQMTQMVLDESIFLVLNPGPNQRIMTFHQARDFAYEIGVITKAPKQKPRFHFGIKAPASETVEGAFSRAMEENLGHAVQQIALNISTILRTPRRARATARSKAKHR